MVRRAARRTIVALVSATVLASLAYLAAPGLSVAAHGPVKTIARSVVTSIERRRDVTLPIAASHVVLHWQGNPNAQLTVALGPGDGTFGPPQAIELDEDGRDDAAPDRPGDGGTAHTEDAFGQVVVADGARAIRVTSDRPIARLTVEVLDTRGSALQDAADAALAVTGAGVADAAVPEPAIISRAAWGANEAYRFDGGGHERWPRSFDPLQKLIVHHTAGANNDPNPAATVRAIYYDHAVLRGYGDIGYNFLIDAQGHVYQGRYSRAYAPGEPITGDDLSGLPVRGGHAKGYNDGTVGIALLGTFTTVQPPAAQRNALIQLLAWESERHGLDPTVASTYVNPVNGNTKWLYNVSGHRDVAATDCPGSAFYSTFSTLRSQVKSKIASLTGAGVDSTPPTATLSPLLTPTGGTTMTFGLPFSEPVTGLEPGDFTVSGTSAGWSVSAIDGTASAYRVTLHSDAPTDGTVVLDLAAASVTDLAGNTGPPAPLEASATFATDTTAPTVVLYATPHRAITNATSLDVTVTFSEPVADLSLKAMQIGGTSDAATPWTIEQMLGSGASYGFTISSPNAASGTLTIAVPDGATTDPAGNPNVGAQLSIQIDRTKPSTSAPTTSLRTGFTYNGSPIRAGLAWSGSDGGGGTVASYDVERSIDGAAFAVIATGLAAPGLGVSLASGHSYRFAVRARDTAGNVGGWRAGSTTSTLVRQNTSGYLTWSSGWTTAWASGYSGGSLRYASKAGAWVSTTFTGRSIALVTTKAPNRGQVRVYVDGAYVTTLDLGAATATYRWIAWARSWSGAGTHTLRLVVVGTAGRPRVDVDAFLILR